MRRLASVPANGRPRRVRAAVAVALCSSLLAGCGGSKAGGSSAGDGDPSSSPGSAAAVTLPVDQAQKAACSLLTQAEVEAAIGARVAPGREEVQAARSLCAFALVSAADQSVVLVSTSSSGVPAAFEAAQAKAQAPQSVAAGDQAFVSGGQALVRRGNTMVAILVALRQQPGQLAGPATRLAQAVGTRL
ncbi:MAG TPA: hypothetical protein VGV86_16380 [Acidimicrobiales bacterium]|nr:hypothetical protein [Acidimicrobiales bacterium]